MRKVVKAPKKKKMTVKTLFVTNEDISMPIYAKYLPRSMDKFHVCLKGKEMDTMMGVQL